MNNKYKLFNDIRHGEKIQVEMYKSRKSLGLDRFLGSMISIEDWKKNNYSRQEEFEITLEYLSKLLRTGELKMKTFEREEDMSKRKVNSITYILKSSKEWKQEEVEQGIEYVRKKWNSFEDSRESFESWGVMFTLPENEWMY